ncbi:hypothetical protein HK099_006710 [Clydaea vesicula]|uniref:Uncharacterized protein n=1 Tax=Clydaea vesicula TaxID=447962 RepID=A0AAD5UBZ6_9FUNG|nr:hypothetical protein HK099_006710 [Clydaea vesicula]
MKTGDKRPRENSLNLNGSNTFPPTQQFINQSFYTMQQQNKQKKGQQQLVNLKKVKLNEGLANLSFSSLKDNLNEKINITDSNHTQLSKKLNILIEKEKSLCSTLDSIKTERQKLEFEKSKNILLLTNIYDIIEKSLRAARNKKEEVSGKKSKNVYNSSTRRSQRNKRKANVSEEEDDDDSENSDELDDFSKDLFHKLKSGYLCIYHAPPNSPQMASRTIYDICAPLKDWESYTPKLPHILAFLLDRKCENADTVLNNYQINSNDKMILLYTNILSQLNPRVFSKKFYESQGSFTDQKNVDDKYKKIVNLTKKSLILLTSILEKSFNNWLEEICAEKVYNEEKNATLKDDGSSNMEITVNGFFRNK